MISLHLSQILLSKLYTMTATIRKIKREDLASLKEVIDTSDLFPSEYLDEMIQPFFSNVDSSDIWLTQEHKGKPISIAYCAPERMTEGTFNLYLIAVHKNYQSRGLGAELIKYLEERLAAEGVRVLIVETSGLDDFERTRNFYDQQGYHREAVIRDFYQEGENKVVFWKRLQS